uniref:Putative ring-hydroxylating dioxygenase large subunit n=1 Tax=Mycobacterium sp. SNP11 TaxID=406423 RepID=A0FKG1_9MYCO|nr:putative ring-hydroxylating dioxygenase large subunit [Mycobacterium sp. SNP11]
MSTVDKNDIQQLVAAGREGLVKGRLPAGLVANAELHKLEAQRVFGRCWQFLAHETEIPQAGDYVVRYLGGGSIIVVRGEDGEVRAMANSCRHRGTMLCRTEMGNTSHFRCPYHGWTYRNTGTLAGVPAQKEVYGVEMDKNEWSLTQVPRLENYGGMIFGCLDEKAEPLVDYLGDMAWYLDLITQKSKGGLEVRGEPQRWIIDSNWKLGADNFVGDAYHTLMTHRSAVELGLAPPDPKFASEPAHISLSNGHGLGVLGVTPGQPMPPFMNYPPEIVDGLAAAYGDQDRADMLQRSAFIHGTVFPNLSFLNVLIGRDKKSMPVPMLTFRLWRPLSHDTMEVWSWFLVEKDADEEFKQQSYETYVRTFGISGVFEQDDAETWRSITAGTQGILAGSQTLNFEMGMGVLTSDDTWKGPGRPLSSGYAERNQREFWGRLLELLTDSGDDASETEPKPQLLAQSRTNTDEVA